jgi:uncharacterized protein YcnI
MRHHRRVALALLGGIVIAAWGAASAAAHAVVQPSASRPADLQRYTLTVPNERAVPTVAVHLAVPSGIDFFLVEDTPGWTSHVEKRNGRIVGVLFDGGTIPPDFFETFRFIVKNPVQSGEIAWDVRQDYQGGEIVDWAGPPGSDTPAARTEISESAVPVDTVDVASGRSAVQAGAAAAPAAEGRDGLTLGLAIAALVLAGVAAAAQVLRGRKLA